LYVDKFICLFRSRRILTTHEVIDVLESWEAEDVHDIEVYVEPPGDGRFSDGDSGGEDCSDLDRLNRHQLLAPAEVIINANNNDDTVYSDIEDDTTELPTSSQALILRRGRLFRRPRKWVKQDLSSAREEWLKPFPRTVLTLTKNSEPLQFFELFFSADMIEHIVKHSVMYAVANHNFSFTLSADEIYCFIGILLLSGYAPLPRRRMYWEENEDTHNVLVSKSIRRNRFEEIFRYLHVADNENLPPGDKMAKIRPLFDIMNEMFLVYAPIEKDISIDESMIPYYGRHGCKQHIRGKPIHFGFKAWVAATRLGYCLQAELYEGRTQRISEGLGLGEHVVTKLRHVIQNMYTNTAFSVYCDNFFTSPTLLSNLQDKNIKVTGTVRQNRTDNCPLADVKICKKTSKGVL
jgi:hypothetical protein